MNVQWKIIPFETVYEVSTDGNVRNVKTLNVKSKRLDKYGYERVTLYPSGKTYSIHRLIMLTFYPQNKMEHINHKDGIKTNNSITNLEWCTSSHNAKHRSTIIHPNLITGSKNPMAKIDENIAKKIKYDSYDGMNNKQIGELFGVSSEVVRRIRSGERWKHI